ncbi:hypothetical protein [Streptomyces sp. LS1784]|uniref:hypothetical protein n=1 Tax=Streptomyces sp. LS1784 TaxID=2851533 RepID=UPI001CCBCB78|nr:hypothetical protein [Streptomyces sp. LS1784]
MAGTAVAAINGISAAVLTASTQAQVVGSVSGHTTDVLEHETVIRLPADMLQFIPRPDEEAQRGNTGS